MSDAGCPWCGGIGDMHDDGCEYEDMLDGNEEDYADE